MMFADFWTSLILNPWLFDQKGTGEMLWDDMDPLDSIWYPTMDVGTLQPTMN